MGRLAWVVAGDGPSFGPEAGDALNFGPTGRMGVPHLVHEQIFRNGFVKQDEELEGGARRERRGSLALPLKRRKKRNPGGMWKSYKSQPSWDRIFIKKSIFLMRGNNLNFLEKKLRKKMSRSGVWNLIQLLTQLTLVLTILQNFEEVSPQHNVIAQFFKDIAMFPPKSLFLKIF